MSESIEQQTRTPRVPASPLVVKDLVLEILNAAGGPLKRSEVIERVRRIAPRRGFTLSSGTAPTTTKKALALLFAAKKVITPRLGWYSLPTTDLGTCEEQSIPDESFEEIAEAQPKLKIMRQIGEGPESVYVYFHEVYLELASSKGRAIWECKVGWTIGEPDARVIGQGGMTCFPRPPVIGLVIRTHDGRNLERLLHAALSYAGAKIEEGAGSEWFLTSPELIEQWFVEFSKTVAVLKPASCAAAAR